MEIPFKGATFVVGESGTGKTTLLKLFNQTETQSSGSISFRGSDVAAMSATDLRRSVILCGQTVFLFDGTIRDNFTEFRRYRGLPPLPDDDIIKFLNICHAEPGLDKACRNLSGGERARVFIGIHLSFAPMVLMLDEPTSALDKDTAVAVMRDIRSHCSENGTTLIVVSHDHSVVDAFADNIIDMGGKKDG